MKDEKHDFTIGTVCRLIAMKGIYEFADVIEKLKTCGVNARGVIVGDGPERLRLERYINKKNLQNDIILTGRKEHSIINAYYKLFDLFLLTSKTEGLGIVILEAMQNGVPSFSLDSGGPRDIITNGYNGYIEKNVNELFKRIKMTLSDSSEMQKMRVNAELTAEGFSWEKAAFETLEFYSYILRKFR